MIEIIRSRISLVMSERCHFEISLQFDEIRILIFQNSLRFLQIAFKLNMMWKQHFGVCKKVGNIMYLICAK